MPPYIHPIVEESRNNPTADQTIRVILVCEEEAIPKIREEMSSLNSSISRELSKGMMTVEASESELSDLCELSGVKSISPDEEMEILA